MAFFFVPNTSVQIINYRFDEVLGIYLFYTKKHRVYSNKWYISFVRIYTMFLQVWYIIFFFASKIYFFFFFWSIAYSIVYIFLPSYIFLISFFFFVPCSTLYFKVQKQTRANLPYLSMLFTDYQVTWTFHQSLSWILNRADL